MSSPRAEKQRAALSGGPLKTTPRVARLARIQDTAKANAQAVKRAIRAMDASATRNPQTINNEDRA